MIGMWLYIGGIAIVGIAVAIFMPSDKKRDEKRSSGLKHA